MDPIQDPTATARLGISGRIAALFQQAQALFHRSRAQTLFDIRSANDFVAELAQHRLDQIADVYQLGELAQRGDQHQHEERAQVVGRDHGHGRRAPRRRWAARMGCPVRG